MPRQRQFRADLKVVDGCLDELIALARRTSQPEDLEALQARDYSKVGSAWIRAEVYSAHGMGDGKLHQTDSELLHTCNCSKVCRAWIGMEEARSHLE